MGEPIAEVLETHWVELSRLFSPMGFKAFLESVSNLKALGRGDELVISFIESAGPVTRSIGETAVFELLSSVIKMFSKASAEVLAMVFKSAPVAVSRLGEAELFVAYLSLLDIAAKAPRALRPLLGQIEQLLGVLTLGGLRRWITWGIQAHRTDFAAQEAYFSLATPESRAVLQRERRGVLFVDVQRRLVMYLRALWGRDFFLRPTSGDFESRAGYRPFIDELFINLPDAYDDYAVEGEQTVDGLTVYRAAAAHAPLTHEQERIQLLARFSIGLRWLYAMRIHRIPTRLSNGRVRRLKQHLIVWKIRRWRENWASL
ncbi:MAG: hypothetical protein B7X28_09430 [Halothiobacillus sp. 13-55-253]|nr:MAG: hypothetical protein B7X28_09430 [Halothiobacillus sp. 13-55-253]